ncbi:multifunctional pyrimidine synthesis protein CAD [Zygosaccharomyces mellis]|uniref:Carbamoyl phosphate synthase arginine-specific small chain n=1 Tax=Zygosaccharomyces mellis TaxID=42258 RepID=A0A4C2E952_9SACH|nr:multifunctional pyrimidine synthesis protein CAD [Zygosaccharomyces mellis]
MSEATFSIRNGPTFKGISFGAEKAVAGEAVFTTSLVGYPESMSDPSYTGQILVFTQPLIGNYGVPSSEARDQFNLLRFFESPHAHVVGIIVAEYAYEYSHWTAVESLGSWCKREGVAAVTGVDTREVVQYLREQGSSLGRISIQGQKDAEWIDPMGVNLVAKVTTKHPYHVRSAESKYNVALIDCGVKENIVRCLVTRGANVTVFPYDYKIQNVAQQFDGVFISNGPGDPGSCSTTILNLKELLQDERLQDLPIFGICLGHQLLALASGGSTHKLKYGNRAHNIPAMDLTTGQCHITSQNHGYAVDAASLPKDWVPFFINLNDQSNEGMIHAKRPIFSTQFHPEAKGGPTDSAVLFDKYFNELQQFISKKQSDAKLNATSSVALKVEELPTQRVL